MGLKSWWRNLRAKAATGGPGGTTVIQRVGVSSPPPRRGTVELFRAYRESPWLRTVEGRLANECATATKLRLYDGPEDDDQRELIRRGDRRYEILELLRRPVRVSSGQIMTARQRNKICALWYWLAGEAYLVKQRGPGRRVVGLVPLSPLWVRGTPTPADPRYRIQVDTEESYIAADDVIPLVDLDAENPYGRGSGLAMSLGDDLDCDEGLAVLSKSLVLNRNVPEGLVVMRDVKTKKQLEEQRTNWEERFAGPDRGGRVEFVGGDAQFIPLTMKSSDAQLLEARRYERDTIMQVHGVSGEIFGVLEQSTRDSIESAYTLLALGVQVPWLDVLADAYQSHLVPEFGDPEDMFLAYKSPVPNNRDLQLRTIAVTPSAFRVRDLREVGGFAPDTERGEDVLVAQPIVAGPTNLPPGKGGDPVFTRADVGDEATEPVRSLL